MRYLDNNWIEEIELWESKTKTIKNSDTQMLKFTKQDLDLQLKEPPKETKAHHSDNHPHQEEEVTEEPLHSENLTSNPTKVKSPTKYHTKDNHNKEKDPHQENHTNQQEPATLH